MRKSFRHAVRSFHLQDRLLHPRRSKEQWSIEALDGVSLALAPGEWLGLYGENGSGKTTLLRALAGLLVPDSGIVRRRGKISCFFDLGVGFHDEQPAAHNIYMHGLLHGLSGSAARARIRTVIGAAGMASHADLPLKYYSTGMRMRLGFAAAIAIDADIYLFDEVLAVGDAAFREECFAIVRRLKNEGKAAIFVSHHIEELEKVCDRIVTIGAGKITGERAVA